ncbi:MAG: hypothetical protein ACXWRE_00065 [Pseudobdellovibrionaceae bacterium]
MKIANILSTGLLTFLALTSKTAWASFDDYQHFRKGIYDFEIETQYFKTEANYTSSGSSYHSLPYGQSYDIFNAYLKFRHDLSKKSSWYGHLNIANATSYGVDFTRSNSSISDAKLGYAYRPYNELFDVIMDFNVLLPFNQINPNTDTALNNEGVSEATGLLRLQREFSTISVFGYIGGTYRQSRSSLLPWGTGVEATYSKWGWGGKIFGYQSITDDPDTANKIQRLIVIDRVDAGSEKFYSVNPSVVDSEAFVKFRFNNAWTLTTGGGATLTGSNTAAGYHAGISLLYSWDSEPSYYLKSTVQEDELGSEKKVPKFKEEIDDGVNQKLFQKKGTPAPTPTPRSGGDLSPAPDNVAMKRVDPQPQPSQFQESNSGGEVQLKLKRKKKRKRSS